MAEQDRLTSRVNFAFGTGLTIVLAGFGAQTAGWSHWIGIGIAYGAGSTLMLFAIFWFFDSYFAKEGQENGFEKLSKTVSTEVPTSTLKSKALKLAEDLKSFLARIGSEPTPNPSLIEGQQLGGATKYLAAMYACVNDWRLRCQSEFDIELRPQIQALLLAYGKQGISDVRLKELIYSEMNESRVREILARLIALAYKDAHVTLDIPRADKSPADIFLWRTVQNLGSEEYDYGLREVTGFQEAVNEAHRRVNNRD